MSGSTADHRQRCAGAGAIVTIDVGSRRGVEEAAVARRTLGLAVTAAAVVAVANTVARSVRRSRAERRPADVRFMLAMHGALRRDIGRLQSVSRSFRPGGEVPPAVLDGWDLFRRQLEVHHHAEDDDLWPMLRAHVDDDAALVEIDAMVREHERIPPALDAVSRALGRRDDLAGPVDALAMLLHDHLEHEERSVLPLIERSLT